MTLPKINIPKKPNYRALTEGVDCFEIFKKLERAHSHCFILESLGQDSHTSRYSVIGFDPDLMISARDNKLQIEARRGTKQTQEFTVDNPYLALREIVPQDVISRRYAGGLVGYLSYECASYFEPALKLRAHDKFAHFHFGVFKDGLLFDKMTGETIYFYYEDSRFDEIAKLIANKDKPASSPLAVKFLGDTLTRVEHAKQVEYVKEQIRGGYIFQCEVGFKSEFSISGDKIQIYEKLRKVNPSPHMYYLKFADSCIIGASPELLFRLKESEMETFPLAGSIRRGKDTAEDQELARHLLRDPKEVAEHSMLVDLHRNDLGKVAEFGTVKVRSFLDIKRFSHVQHISSEVVGILRRGEDMFSALAGNFPAGTLSGCPKIEAMKIIDQLEKSPRGPYGGALGHFGFDGNCTFAIPIRTLFCHADYGYIQTCGGIVYDSVPENEYDEIQRKLSAMRIVLEEFKINAAA